MKGADDVATFSVVRDAELREIAGRRRAAAGSGPPDPDTIVGLALSGGGIRSATFSLGVLQGLHRLGLLWRFDYVSTVSGGGYAGGWWSAWLSRDRKGPGVFPEDEGIETQRAVDPAI